MTWPSKSTLSVPSFSVRGPWGDGIVRGAKTDKILSGEDTWQFSGPGNTWQFSGPGGSSRGIETGDLQETAARTWWDRSWGPKPAN